MNQETDNSTAMITARLASLIDNNRTPQIVDVSIFDVDRDSESYRGQTMTLSCEYYATDGTYKPFDISFAQVPTALAIKTQFENHKNLYGYRDIDSIEQKISDQNPYGIKILSGAGFQDVDQNPIPALDIEFEFRSVTWYDG